MNKRNRFGSIHQNPDRIIIHAMGEWFDHEGDIISAKEFLHTIGLSAHVLITPSGECVRVRSDNEGAYHAKGNNKNTLGIEFLVPGIYNFKKYPLFLENINQPYLTNAAYDVGVNQIRRWIDSHDIKSIHRHSDIDPHRKKDPGNGFPYDRMMDDIGI